jgi:tetratricopeptide (TPR) repeat protein
VSAQARRAEADALADKAYEAAFNLDRAEAMAAARQLVALEPRQSRSHRVLATVLWTDILFRIGAVTVDHFIGSLTKSQDTRPPIPPDVEREFEDSVGRAIDLAETRLSEHPDSVDARYELGASCAIQASFRASIGGSLTAAFRSARKAYKAQEEVLERDPTHPNANVIAGTYRYAISGLRFPSRWFAYLAGFSGDRERGIAMVEAAANGPATVYDALPALLLIYAREKRYEDALAVADRLSQAFPRNRLFVLEVGSAALRAGRASQAERVLRQGVEALTSDERPKAPGEEALWLYKWGSALIELGRTAQAADLLDRALERGPLGWVEGRIHLELGKVADLESRRAEAVEAYRLARTIAARDNDPVGRDAAEALLEQPYRSGSRP